MLFQKVITTYRRPNYGGNGHKRVVVIHQQPARPPKDGFMARLDVLCHGSAHPLPVKMKFIGTAPTHQGGTCYVFACPFDQCNHREGWVRHHITGK